MKLAEKVWKIAKAFGISEDELILDAAKFYQDQHWDHGIIDIRIGINPDGTVDDISLVCSASALPALEQADICPQYYSDAPAELTNFVVYQKGNVGETAIQAQYRLDTMQSSGKYYSTVDFPCLDLLTSDDMVFRNLAKALKNYVPVWEGKLPNQLQSQVCNYHALHLYQIAMKDRDFDKTLGNKEMSLLEDYLKSRKLIE